MLFIGLIGFLTTFLGKLAGLIISFFGHSMGRRFEGCITAFTAGLLLAFICFEMLEEGFLAAPLHIGVAGILAGVVLAAYLDGKINGLPKGDKNKASMLVAMGVAIHNFPEGIALGSMCAVSLYGGLKLAVIIAIHCIPESAAIFLPMKNGRSRLILLSLLTLPMTAGAMLGVLLTEISGVFLYLSLTFAAGVMLYITTGEILPESRRLWQGRLTTVFSALGFILGVVITA